MRSTDDVTPVELFLERGLKKDGIFFPPPSSYYYSKPFTSASSSHSLFNLTVLVNLEPPIVASHGNRPFSCIHMATLRLLSPERNHIFESYRIQAESSNGQARIFYCFTEKRAHKHFAEKAIRD